MIANWRKIIKDDDSVLHLGDLMMGGDKFYDHFKSEIAPNLPGKKYIILGNHDKRKYDYEAIGFTIVKPFAIKYRGHDVSFNHYPKLFNIDEDKTLHVHGHIHNHTYSRGEINRWGNINVSMEVMDYKPRKINRLLNKEITKRNKLLNSPGFTLFGWKQANTRKQTA